MAGTPEFLAKAGYGSLGGPTRSWQGRITSRQLNVLTLLSGSVDVVSVI